MEGEEEEEAPKTSMDETKVLYPNIHLHDYDHYFVSHVVCLVLDLEILRFLFFDQ